MKEKYGVSSLDDIGKKFTTDELNNIESEEFSNLLKELNDSEDEKMIPGTFYATNEFKGTYYEIVEYNGRDIQVNYYIWYKLAD